MDKFLALVVATIAGLLAGYFAMSLFSDTFNTLGLKAFGGALAGAVLGGLAASMVGGELNKQSDLGLNLIFGVLLGTIAGVLGGTQFRVVTFIIEEVRRVRG